MNIPGLKRSMAICTILALALVGALAAAQTPDTVRINDGLLTGLRFENSRTFKGIPFAAPPLGDRRWREPQAPTPWTGSWDATDFRTSCLQGPFNPPITNQSEDCLYLNVYAPLPPTNGTLYPVMLWIHGGSYTSGAANESRLNGTWITERFQNVIVVTINYRLNIFGFLGSIHLANRTSDKSYGNYGLQDQRFAMKRSSLCLTVQWVRDNIKNFHGDASKMTIFGESAGAGSVSTHLTSTRSWPLFSQAIMESGAFSLWIAQDAASAEQTFDGAMMHLGCTSVDCLIALDAQTLLRASFNIKPRCSQQIAWSPVIDGVELTDYPWALAQAGNHADVPVIMGSNLDEGSYFVPVPLNLTEAGFNQFVLSTYGPQIGAEVLKLYPASEFPASAFASSYFYAAEHAWGDFGMTCPARRTARWFSRKTSSSYLYQYTRVPTGAQFSYHSCEIPFVFFAKSLLNSPDDVESATIMSALWNSFAVTSTPAPRTVWPPYTIFSDNNLFIDVGLSMGSGLRRAQCDFWDTLLSRKCD